MAKNNKEEKDKEINHLISIMKSLIPWRC